jgi:sugar diacid utilization regulator
MLGVPMVLRGEVIGIVFLDDAQRPHVYTPTESEIASTFADLAAVAIAQAEMTGRLRHSLDTVARQNEMLHRAAAMDDKLTALVLAGGNLAEIAEAVAELTGKPCEIYDAEHRRLAAGMPPGWEGGPAWRGLDRAVREHPDVQKALEALGEKSSGVIGPLPRAGLEDRYLVAPIATRDEVWGSLAIVRHGSDFGSLDAHIARRAATNVALELVAERRAAHAEWDARASLAGDLIRGTSDPTAVRRRAEYLGVDLAAPHVLCLIGTTRDGVLPSTAEVAGAFVARVPRRGVLAATMAEGILVVLRLDEQRPALDVVGGARDVTQEVLNEVAGQTKLLAAIGPCCTDVEDYVRAYDDVRQAMSCLRIFADGEHSVVLAADDLGVGRLFLASSTPAEADRFLRDALGALLDAGDPALADLLETLQVFFESSRSVRQAARRLGVHENTIRYRLARVQTLTGLGIGSDPNDELTAHLALLILRMQRLTSGRTRGSTAK